MSVYRISGVFTLSEQRMCVSLSAEGKDFYLKNLNSNRTLEA